MSWRLEISHVTRYRYDRPVVASYNEARLTPLSTAGQFVSETQIAVRPATQLFCFTDYWGTLVHVFDVHSPHQSLLVTSKAVVETAPAASSLSSQGGARGSASWDDLAKAEVEDRFYEFLAPSRFVTPDDLSGVAKDLKSSSATPADVVASVLDWVSSQLEYGPGATHVHSSAIEAWRAGQGVCQDFAHLSLAVLRATGIPARYVSGYFYPDVTREVGTKVVGESHAWIDTWTGAWAGHDPTNRTPVAERHVVVARGRDYADVVPVRGIFSGPPGSSAEVTVELTRRA